MPTLGESSVYLCPFLNHLLKMKIITLNFIHFLKHDCFFCKISAFSYIC